MAALVAGVLLAAGCGSGSGTVGEVGSEDTTPTESSVSTTQQQPAPPCSTSTAPVLRVGSVPDSFAEVSEVKRNLDYEWVTTLASGARRLYVLGGISADVGDTETEKVMVRGVQAWVVRLSPVSGSPEEFLVGWSEPTGRCGKAYAVWGVGVDRATVIRLAQGLRDPAQTAVSRLVVSASIAGMGRHSSDVN